MTKAVWTTLAAAAVLALAVPASAQSTDTATVSITVNVNARAKLTVGTASVVFADADPGTVPTLTSSGIAVSAKVRTGGASTATLTVLSDQDLTSGSDTIAVSNLTWTVGGTAGFSAGTMDKTTAQTLGSWSGSGNRSDTQTYSLPNSWAYNVGSYTATITYTLTAP